MINCNPYHLSLFHDKFVHLPLVLRTDILRRGGLLLGFSQRLPVCLLHVGLALHLGQQKLLLLQVVHVLHVVTCLHGRDTVKPSLKDHPIGHKNVVCQDRWSLVTGSVILKCRSYCRKYVVCQDRWSHGSGLSKQLFTV